MEYLLSNICTKNYRNWTTTVKIIVDGWVVYFFETQCIYHSVYSHMLVILYHTPIPVVRYALMNLRSMNRNPSHLPPPNGNPRFAVGRVLAGNSNACVRDTRLRQTIAILLLFRALVQLRFTDFI